MRIEEFRGACRCAEHGGQKILNGAYLKVESDADADILEFILLAVRNAEQAGGMEASARKAKAILMQLQAANN